MKKRTSYHPNPIYIFIIILFIIGFISGIQYYNIQDEETKNSIKEQYQIQENLQYQTNNIFKNIKKNSTIYLSSLTPITALINIFKNYYEPFTIGFLNAYLKTINKNFAYKYILIYHLIPLIILIIILKTSYTITKNITLYIIKKNKKLLIKIKKLSIKFLIISIINIIYELIIFIYSTKINEYLISLITNI